VTALHMLKADGFTVGGWAVWELVDGYHCYPKRGKITHITPSGTITVLAYGAERQFRRNRHGSYTDNLRPATVHELAIWGWLTRWRGLKRVSLREVDPGNYTVMVSGQAVRTVEEIAGLVEELNTAARLLAEKPVAP
jgi:hypothetical protein